MPVHQVLKVMHSKNRATVSHGRTCNQGMASPTPRRIWGLSKRFLAGLPLTVVPYAELILRIHDCLLDWPGGYLQNGERDP